MKEINISKSVMKKEKEDNKRDEEIINRYLRDLDRDIKERTFDVKDIPSELIAIAEMYDLLIDKEKWLENIYILLTNMKREIKDVHPIAFFGGLAEMAFSTTLISKKTGHYVKFKKQINDMLYSNMLIMTKDFEEKKII